MHGETLSQANKWLESRLKSLRRSKSELARAMGWANARVTALVQGRRQVKVHELPDLSRFLEIPTIELVGLLNNGDVGFTREERDLSNRSAPTQFIEVGIPRSEIFESARRQIKAALELKAEVSGKPISREMLEDHATLLARAFIALGSGDGETGHLDVEGAAEAINAIKAVTRKG